MEHFDLLGVKIAAVDLPAAFQFIEHAITRKDKTYVCVAPVATIVDCQKNKDYLDVINQSGLTTPDGMPLVWIGKWKGKRKIQRTYGPDLMLAVCEQGQAKGYRHFFYGGREETNNLLVQRLKRQFPRIEVSGQYAPPQIALGSKEDRFILRKINESRTDILWVGLGSPKQDYWMSMHREELNVPVLVGVGAAFDFLAGTKRQAPQWMQKSGFEWLFRLSQEPARLWRRYLIGNTEFLLYLMKDYFRLKKKAG